MRSPAQDGSVWLKNTGMLGSSRRASTTAPFSRSVALWTASAAISTAATVSSPASSFRLSFALRR